MYVKNLTDSFRGALIMLTGGGVGGWAHLCAG